LGQDPIPQIRLKPEAKISHPWIFQRSIDKPATKLPPGTVVDVLTTDGRWAGRGFYNGHAQIGARILTYRPDEEINASLILRRIERAIKTRLEGQRLSDRTDSCRLVNSEGDDLSGLVIDRFGSILSIELYAAGMFRFLPAIKEFLSERFPGSHLYWFAEKRVQKQESFDLWEPAIPEPAVIHENGVRFLVSPGMKHKTGFFLDQRENRLTLAQHCRDRSVLDLCCYSGGFSVYAATLGRAKSVTGVDLDDEAIELAERNAKLNDCSVDFQTADIFEWLTASIERRDRFDVIVLDPPKQTRSRDDIDKALSRYFAMNKLAMQVLAPGGILLTCSCSGLIREDQFLSTIGSAAGAAKRTMQVFRVTGPGDDHPFNARIPEGRYLKAVWCRALDT